MLKAIKTKKARGGGFSFAIVASKYNAKYVDAMVREAQKELQRAGAKQIEIVRVPGAHVDSPSSRRSWRERAGCRCQGLFVSG